MTTPVGVRILSFVSRRYFQMKKSNCFCYRILPVALCAAMLGGCGASAASSSAAESTVSTDSAPLKVMVSFYPMYDFAQKIGGDKVTVTNMVPAGTEPHDWEPSTTDITNLEDADVFIYSGAGMEHWVDSVLGSLTNQDLDVVQASDGVTLREGYEDEDGDVGADPHVWLAPANAKIEMKNIAEVLCSADPANAEYYRQNYEQWALECDRLDTEFTEALSALPNKNIVVSHEAFGYLCDAYGLNQVGIEGIEADSEPDPARMAEIEDFVKANNVKVIFSEELVSPKVAQTIADATGAQMQELNPLEGLTDDQIADGQDYFTVMRQNLEELKKRIAVKRRGFMNVLEAKDLSFAYGNTPVLDAASFTMCEGGFAALVGVNGAGKSTLLRLLLGEVETHGRAYRTDGAGHRQLQKLAAYRLCTAGWTDPQGIFPRQRE